jgi:hypothetical protein
LIIVFFILCHKPYDPKLAFSCALAGAITISANSDAGNRIQSAQEEMIEHSAKTTKMAAHMRAISNSAAHRVFADKPRKGTLLAYNSVIKRILKEINFI